MQRWSYCRHQDGSGLSRNGTQQWASHGMGPCMWALCLAEGLLPIRQSWVWPQTSLTSGQVTTHGLLILSRPIKACDAACAHDQPVSLIIS